MSAKTKTRSFKTKRPITDSELLAALKNSMGPIFTHFEEKLLEKDGRILDIRIMAKKGSIKLEYGIGDITPESSEQTDDGGLKGQ